MNQSLLSYYHYFVEQLTTVYDKSEAESIANIVFEEILMMKKHHIFIIHKELGDGEINQLNHILSKLMRYEPVQYVLGITDFLGLRFRVNNHVLIPRTETEELVEMVIKDVRELRVELTEDIYILEIGTGSGCIPIALKKNLPFAKITSIDISKDALEVASENAFLNKADVTFMEDDILNPKSSILQSKYSLIISNPPYITESEKSEMHKNVLDNEPHLALFVNDRNPLLFYKAIANFAKNHLTENGKLYFEINESYGEEVQNMLEDNGFQQVVITKDMQGKDRIVKAYLR